MQICTSVVGVRKSTSSSCRFRLVQIRTSVVDDKLSKWLRSGFRLVQIYTSVVEEEVTTMIWNGFRLVQNCTSVVGQSRQNNQWYFVIKHQTYFIDALIYIIPFSDTNVNRKWLFYTKHFYHLPSFVLYTLYHLIIVNKSVIFKNFFVYAFVHLSRFYGIYIMILAK